LGRGTAADLRLVQDVLSALDEIAERTHNTRYKIEILALRALVLDAQGEAKQAEAVLGQAVELARLGEFIRVFADLGPLMQAMLQRLSKQGHTSGSIGRILTAFPRDGNGMVGRATPAQPGRQQSAGISALAEPLTPREVEVLSLLRGPLSIKEIALKLNISYATAKRHTINLYAKLGVGQRWSAVARAEELNLLPPR